MIIGLTGGIAAGKSTVRETLASRHGVEVFDADAFAHRLLESDNGVAAKIDKEFGSRCLSDDGRPDRKALRELVFHDVDARRKLEGILHPLVRAEWLAQREQCHAKGAHFLADIPLLYETHSDGFFDRVVVVACSPSVQMIRLEARGLSAETAHAMLASQLPMRQKVEESTFVIWNDGSMESLRRQTQYLANLLFDN
jgi:dephospho-CoA kinase